MPTAVAPSVTIRNTGGGALTTVLRRTRRTISPSSIVMITPSAATPPRTVWVSVNGEAVIEDMDHLFRAGREIGGIETRSATLDRTGR
ncbi:hypothetical protein GCM10010483_02620 [Actinokineospora diospyrosa]